MIKIILFGILLAFGVIGQANAEYYVSDYDPDYVPYNLQEAMDSLDFPACENKIKSFDSTYNEYLLLYGTPISVGETLDVEFGALKEVTEEEFRQCLSNAREQEQEWIKEEEEKRALLERDQEIQSAVDNCDFDFFKNDMDNSERMATWNEREACEVKDDDEEEIKTPVVEPIFESIPAPVIYTPPKVAEPIVTQFVTPEPSVDAVSAPERTVVEKEDDVTTTADSGVTTTEELIVVTDEELDRMVEERLKERTEESQIEPESSLPFFKRVTNFLFGWLF